MSASDLGTSPYIPIFGNTPRTFDVVNGIGEVSFASSLEETASRRLDIELGLADVLLLKVIV
jgi:hypothetical protein